MGENLTPLHDPKDGQLRYAGFMSKSGSNLRKLIEHERKLEKERGKSPFIIPVIFSNRYDSNAGVIGYDHDIQVITHDDRGFRNFRGKKLWEARDEFDSETIKALAPFDCNMAALGGYMLFASNVLLNYFKAMINVHPADLSIVNEKGERKYTGDNAVRLAIIAREQFLRSTTHILDDKPDHGPILMISQSLEVKLFNGFDYNNRMDVCSLADNLQSTLKEIGDWVVFPRTLEYIADGRFAKDSQGRLYFDGEPIPNGLRL